MPFDGFNPGDPTTWPVWMREDDICTEGGHVGPFPASRFQWRKLAPSPVKFGSRISCWHRNVVAQVCKLPPPDPEPAVSKLPVAHASRQTRRRTSQLANVS
jgi:hypothetical protein